MQLLSEVGRHVINVGGEVHIHGFQQLTLDSIGLIILCHMSIMDLEIVLFLDKVGEVEARTSGSLVFSSNCGLLGSYSIKSCSKVRGHRYSPCRPSVAGCQGDPPILSFLLAKSIVMPKTSMMGLPQSKDVLPGSKNTSTVPYLPSTKTGRCVLQSDHCEASPPN